jgi:hypothetical protein
MSNKYLSIVTNPAKGSMFSFAHLNAPDELRPLEMTNELGPDELTTSHC